MCSSDEPIPSNVEQACVVAAYQACVVRIIWKLLCYQFRLDGCWARSLPSITHVYLQSPSLAFEPLEVQAQTECGTSCSSSIESHCHELNHIWLVCANLQRPLVQTKMVRLNLWLQTVSWVRSEPQRWTSPCCRKKTNYPASGSSLVQSANMLQPDANAKTRIPGCLRLLRLVGLLHLTVPLILSDPGACLVTLKSRLAGGKAGSGPM